MTKETALRLIYIHGFQGDHTSFQAFPTDLHEYLVSRLPPGLALESCLYPTYKSRKPIAEASANFIDWLSTQPPGPVILLAHSMGGLLAADVATGKTKESKRVMGLVAFDVPYLGMHPHVIISGIFSLFPKDDSKDKVKTEKELNDDKVVNYVHSADIDNARGSSLDPDPPTPNSVGLSNGSQSPPSQSPNPEGVSLEPLRPLLSHAASSSSSRLSDQYETMKSKLYSSNSQSKQSQSNLSHSRSSPTPHPSSQSFVSSLTASSTAYLFSRIPPLSPPLVAKLERAADRISHHVDSPLVRWLRKHADDPLAAMSSWVVEHFEFGICMFDPAGLSERYSSLERWDGQWVNFWTETPARNKDPKSTIEDGGKVDINCSGDEGQEEANDTESALPGNTADLAHFADVDEQTSDKDVRAQAKARKKAEKALRKEREKERKRGVKSIRPARHFIVLPHARNTHSDALHFGSRERWERVPIRGVEDEVGAHCGLFIRAQNPEYEELITRVGGFVQGWCKDLKT